MNELLEALKIFQSHGEVAYPTGCEHDTLHINGKYNPDDFSEEEKSDLEKLGFIYDGDHFYSYKYGSM